jgi:hypothetical protein|nr:MAG TPA: Nucleotide modification associated domain 1 [Crassvirales sp.]
MAKNRRCKNVIVPIKDRTLMTCVHESIIDENVLSFRAIQDKLVNIYAKKNHDYGDSFNQGCDELGVGYAFSRIFDKTKRFQTLAKGIMTNSLSIEVQDETIEDTIMDLANYCMMYLAWRDKHVSIGEAEAKQGDIQAPSTGELKSNTDTNNTQESVKEYHKIGAELHKAISKLMLEQTDCDCTNEVINIYGVDLYKDNNNYVYIKTITDEYVNVTFEDHLVKVIPNN